MAVVARIKKEGKLLLKDTITERLPVVTDGLVAYYPLDSNAGAVDVIRGNGTLQNLESKINILESISTSWRNASIWQNGNVTWDETEQALKAVNGCDGYASNFIAIDTTKSYYLEADVKIAAGTTGVLYYGYRFYDVNFTEIGVGQHHGTYDYTGCSYYTPTTTWTHVNNTGIGGAPKTGEGLTGSAVFHTGTKYVKLLFLFNYGGSGTTWVRNLILSTSNANTSNAVLTEDGVAIQEATTNLLPNQPTPTWSPWSGFLGTSTNFIAPNGHIGIILQVFSGGGCQWKGGVDWIPVSPSTTYTISCKIKFSDISKVHPNFFYIRQYTSLGGSQITEYGVFNSANISKLDNGYYLTWSSFTTTATTNSLIIHGYEYTGNQTISCYDMQLEQKTYATAFVNGSNSHGYLAIPNPVKTGNYTINFKCAIPTTVGTVSSYQTIMSMGGYYSTNSWTIMDKSSPNVAGLQTLIRKGAADEWAWQSGNMSNPSNFNNKNVYTIVRNTTDYLCYFNGVYTGGLAHLSTTMQDLIWIGSRDGGGAEGASVISELSIYNRALSETEVKALAGEGFKVNTTKATTPLLVESPVIPLDAYYFPLASDTLDSSKTIDAVDKTNIVFEDGSAWVGTSTTNLFSSPDDFSSASWNKGGVTTSNPNLVTFSGQAPLYQPKGVYSNGNVYSITWRMAGLVSNQIIHVSLEGAVDIGYPSVTLSKYMKTYYRSGTANGTGNFNPLLYQFTGENNNLSTIRLLYAQLEQKIFPSPFVNGTRGASSLEYNLNSSIGLDWNGNWSICYWKKPLATYTDDLGGYNIDSFGSNANSVGGGYTWYGKNNGSYTIYDATPATAFAPADYFGLWHFITIVKSSTTLTIKTQLNNGAIYSRTVSIGTIPANYYVNQYGYDFKLGGWDNGNSTNTYFRDLIVVKRALSDGEIQNIYKQFSIYKTKVNTDDLIEEGL